MNIDTARVYNPLPYNIVDKNITNNRQGTLPSYSYKQKRTIWLNTAYATTSVNDGGTTYYEFSFDIPPFQLYNQTKLSVASYVVNENTSKPCIIKLKNLQFENNNTYNSDKEGYPTLYVNHTGAIGMEFNKELSLTLPPQLINNITIKITSSFTSRDAGFTISSQGVGHFILCLLFQDDDLMPDNIVSQYK